MIANSNIALALIRGKWSVPTMRVLTGPRCIRYGSLEAGVPCKNNKTTTTSSYNSPSKTKEGQYQRQYRFLLIVISPNLPNGFASNLDRVNWGEGIYRERTDFPISCAQGIKKAVFLQVLVHIASSEKPLNG